MPPKTRRPKPFIIRLSQDREPHRVTSAKFAECLRRGLIVCEPHTQRVATLRTGVIGYLIEGALLLIDLYAEVGPGCKTNSMAIERLWLIAHAGEYPLSREERQAEAEMRTKLRGQVGEQQIEEFIRDQRARRREWAIRGQYRDSVL